MPHCSAYGSQVLLDGDSAETDCVEACKLIEVVLTNCKARIDAWLPKFIELVLKRFAENPPRSSGLVVVLIEQIAHGLYYNPRMLIQILESLGATQV